MNQYLFTISARTVLKSFFLMKTIATLVKLERWSASQELLAFCLYSGEILPDVKIEFDAVFITLTCEKGRRDGDSWK